MFYEDNISHLLSWVSIPSVVLIVIRITVVCKTMYVALTSNGCCFRSWYTSPCTSTKRMIISINHNYQICCCRTSISLCILCTKFKKWIIMRSSISQYSIGLWCLKRSINFSHTVSKAQYDSLILMYFHTGHKL